MSKQDFTPRAIIRALDQIDTSDHAGTARALSELSSHLLTNAERHACAQFLPAVATLVGRMLTLPEGIRDAALLECLAQVLDDSICVMCDDLEVRDRGTFQCLLGDAYRAIGQASAAALDQAGRHYKMALELLQACGPVELLAHAHHQLGAVYTQIGRAQDALTHLLEAAEVYSEYNMVRELAVVHSDIGLVYLMGDDPEASEDAIAHLRMALRLLEKDADMFYRGVVHYRLGLAFRHRHREARTDNLDTAIEHFRTAIVLLDCKSEPRAWALAMGDLGSTLYIRHRRGPADCLSEALRLLQAAQAVFTSEYDPRQWALLERKVASAYSTLAELDPKLDIGTPLRHFDNAISMFRRVGEDRLAEATTVLCQVSKALLESRDPCTQSE